MNNTQKINQLWDQMRDAIDATYKAGQGLSGGALDNANVLRDYARDISWSDDLAALLGRETANERQHRSNRPSVPGFSAGSAAKLILMENVRKGAGMAELPKATAFLVLRQTAVEAEVIGFLISGQLPMQWRNEVEALDYSKLMKTA